VRGCKPYLGDDGLATYGVRQGFVCPNRIPSLRTISMVVGQSFSGVVVVVCRSVPTLPMEAAQGFLELLELDAEQRRGPTCRTDDVRHTCWLLTYHDGRLVESFLNTEVAW